MSKVITGAGLKDFIESGKTETMEKKESATEEVKVEQKAEKVEEKEVPVEADGDMMPEETLDQAKAKIAKKHRELKAEKALRMRLQEERDENERLAETQFNERRLYETENQALKRELEELRVRAAPVVVPEIKAPDKDDPKFKNDKGEFQWDKFTDAQANYRVEEFKAQQLSEKQALERAATDANVMKMVETAKAKYPDFEEVVARDERKDVPIYIMQYMRESEMGAELAYYFGKNREELTKISKLSPIMAIARLGKLEVRFEPKAEEKVETKVETAKERTSTAPPPIVPISSQGTGTVTVDPSKMDFKQLRAFEREKNKRKG